MGGASRGLLRMEATAPASGASSASAVCSMVTCSTSLDRSLRSTPTTSPWPPQACIHLEGQKEKGLQKKAGTEACSISIAESISIAWGFTALLALPVPCGCRRTGKNLKIEGDGNGDNLEHVPGHGEL